MKVYVIPAGEGLALPLPANLAAALGLRVGSAVEIRGPAPDGALRYVPIDGEPVAGAPAPSEQKSEPPSPAPPAAPAAPPEPAVPSEPAAPPEPVAAAGPVAAAEVADAVSSPPRGMSVPPPPAAPPREKQVPAEPRPDAPGEGEISQLIARHATSLREVCE